MLLLHSRPKKYVRSPSFLHQGPPQAPHLHDLHFLHAFAWGLFLLPLSQGRVNLHKYPTNDEKFRARRAYCVCLHFRVGSGKSDISWSPLNCYMG